MASQTVAKSEEVQQNGPSQCRMSLVGHPFPGAAPMIAIIEMFLFGVLLIILYVLSTAGVSIHNIRAGLFAACTAFLFGVLIRLVLGIPRIVSSGIHRYQMSNSRVDWLANQNTGNPGPFEPGLMPAQATRDPSRGQKITPEPSKINGANAMISHQGYASIRLWLSTNRTKIGGWLTKLLLGAGLACSTALSQPLGELVMNVARGLGGATASGGVTESAVAMAGAILVAYVALGLLSGYFATTLWHGKWLSPDNSRHLRAACCGARGKCSLIWTASDGLRVDRSAVL